MNLTATVIDSRLFMVYTVLTPMGSSARFFRVDSRQDGKRFPGCLSESARPSLSLAMVFLFFVV